MLSKTCASLPQQVSNDCETLHFVKHCSTSSNYSAKENMGGGRDNFYSVEAERAYKEPDP